MSDTFDRLMAIKRPNSPSHRPGRGTLVIEGIDPARSFNPHACLVGIDGFRKATLDASCPRAIFEVEEGERKVSVRIGRDVSDPLPIQVESGDCVDLICGKRPEWIGLEKQLRRRTLILTSACYGLTAFAWFTSEYVRILILKTIYWFDFEGGYASIGHWVAMRREFTVMFVWFTCCVLSLAVLCVRQSREARRLRVEVGPSCFVALRRSEVTEVRSSTVARNAR